jgi:hypothetical protein
MKGGKLLPNFPLAIGQFLRDLHLRFHEQIPSRARCRGQPVATQAKTLTTLGARRNF